MASGSDSSLMCMASSGSQPLARLPGQVRLSLFPTGPDRYLCLLDL
jgi:hypothetical protein